MYTFVCFTVHEKAAADTNAFWHFHPLTLSEALSVCVVFSEKLQKGPKVHTSFDISPTRESGVPASEAPRLFECQNL